MDKITRFKHIYNMSLMIFGSLCLIGIIILSVLSAHFDKGGFIEIGFWFYLLIYTLMIGPFAILAIAAGLLVKEFILYKKYGSPIRRFILFTVIDVLIALIGILVVSGLCFSIIDIMILFIIPIVIAIIILFIFAVKTQK